MAEMLDIAGLRSRTTPKFRAELYRQSTERGLNPSFIAAVIRVESNFDPNIQNLGGAPALGLVQFWRDFFPSVAARAGSPNTKWDELRTMSAVRQVPFVVAVFSPQSRRLESPTDYYIANFLPSMVGKPRSTILGKRDSQEKLPGTNLSLGKIYKANPGFDRDGDGKFTLGDVGSTVESVVADARQRPPVNVDLESNGNSSLLALLGAALLGGAYLWRKKSS